MRFGTGFFRGILVSILLSSGAFAGPFSASELKTFALQKQWAATIQGISRNLAALKQQMRQAGLEYDTTAADEALLKLGLQAQMEYRPLVLSLSAAANSGKSTLANLLIGARGANQVTQISARGGSTKLPVAILPMTFNEKDLPLLFGGFTFARLKSAEDATKPSPTGAPHLLWTKSELVPSSVVVVDTPDIDSYHLDNGEQTKALLNVSDLVIAMVTDHYTNRDFVAMLRDVAAAGKKVMMVFNKADLRVHRKNWPLWIKELRQITGAEKGAPGIDVLGAYAIEYNPAKAESGEPLDFYRVGANGDETPEKVEPLDAVMGLQVTELRIRSELGALEKALSAGTGLESFLLEIKRTGQSLEQIQALFSSDPAQEVDFPAMPSGAIESAFQEVWARYHRSWAVTIMRKAPALFQKLVNIRYQSAREAEERAFREREFEFLRKEVLDRVLVALKQLHQAGKVHGRLASAIDSVIDAQKWSEMQEKLRKEHSEMKLVESDLYAEVRRELDQMKIDSPTLYSVFAKADGAITVGELISPVALGLGVGYYMSLPVAEYLIGGSFISGPIQTGVGGVVGAGSAPRISVSGDKLRGMLLKQSLDNVVTRYAHTRILWLMQWLKKDYLKDFYAEIAHVADATQSAEIRALEESISCAREIALQLK